jgi:hypothetical protein
VLLSKSTASHDNPSASPSLSPTALESQHVVEIQ